MFSVLSLVLTAFLVVSAILIGGGPTAIPQTAVPTPSSGVTTTAPISASTGVTSTAGISGTAAVTRTISPYARLAMSVTVGISRSIQVLSPAFAPNANIPQKYTCEGQSISIPFTWTGVPANAKSLAATLEDPDAPVPQGDFIHWVIFNMPPTLTELKEGMPNDAKLADGTIQGLNGTGKAGYLGPCPPSGTHRYIFRMYALDTTLSLPETANRDDLFKAVEGHVIGWGQVLGRYTKGG